MKVDYVLKYFFNCTILTLKNKTYLYKNFFFLIFFFFFLKFYSKINFNFDFKKKYKKINSFLTSPNRHKKAQLELSSSYYFIKIFISFFLNKKIFDIYSFCIFLKNYFFFLNFETSVLFLSSRIIRIAFKWNGYL